MKQQTTTTVTMMNKLMTTLLLCLNSSDARVGTSTRSLASCHPEARKVKIDSITGEQIQMFEVQILSSDDVNIALNKAASQSSTLGTNAAHFSVDGDLTTFSHTDDDNASWEVDLGSTYSLKSVMIKNRWCDDSSDPNGCLCKLSGAMLSLLNEEGEVVSAEAIGDTCGVYDLSIDVASCPPAPTPTTANDAEGGRKSTKKMRPSKCRGVQGNQA